MIYWDTSTALKLYCDESDSAAWKEFAGGQTEQSISSALADAELRIALLRKETRRELRAGGARALHADFRQDVDDGLFRLIPIGADVLEKSIAIAERCFTARRPVHVRTLDSLHLATALILRCGAIATTDERMKDAAKILGLPVATP